jgi:hypothetical protein
MIPNAHLPTAIAFSTKLWEFSEYPSHGGLVTRKLAENTHNFSKK